MSQPALPGMDPAPHLSERQEQALTLIRAHGPLTSEDLGERLRVLRGGRDSGAEWDRSNGRQVAGALAQRGLVREVRGEGWVVSEWEAELEPSSQLGPDDPFPEGF